MLLDPYAISLEHYVKSYVDFKSLETAKERGTYDKAVMRFVLDFTRKSAPKRLWGVDRAKLVDDMKRGITRFDEYELIDLEGHAFAFHCREGYWRVLYSDSIDEYENVLADIPNAFHSELCPASEYLPLSNVYSTHAITTEGYRIDFDYHIADTLVNALGRLSNFKLTEVI